MTDERHLVYLGFPADEAVMICWNMRREGTLNEFIKQQEKIHSDRLKVSKKNESCGL